MKPQRSYVDFHHLTIFFQHHEFCWSRLRKPKENEKPVIWQCANAIWHQFGFELVIVRFRDFLITPRFFILFLFSKDDFDRIRLRYCWHSRRRVQKFWGLSLSTWCSIQTVNSEQFCWTILEIRDTGVYIGSMHCNQFLFLWNCGRRNFEWNWLRIFQDRNRIKFSFNVDNAMLKKWMNFVFFWSKIIFRKFPTRSWLDALRRRRQIVLSFLK